MKKILITLIALWAHTYVQAQVPTQDPYPNAPANAIDINKYSFYIDSIRSVNEQVVAFANTTNNVTATQTINLTGTASGVHQLYAKVTNTNGNPSIINIGNFYMEGDNKYQNIPTAAFDINKYSFYVDSVRSVNEQVASFANTANNVTPIQAINLTGTTSGVHQLYAKVTNTNGNPSIINLGNFYMEGDNKYQNIPTAAFDINKYSFYVDSVRSVNEQVASFANTANNVTPIQAINLTGTTSGVHQLYAKVTNTNGNPSIINLGNFYMAGDNFYKNPTAAADNINRYEFYIDSIRTTNAQPLSFTASSANITTNTPLDLTGTVPGVHQLYARVFDINGKQSIVNLGNFAMDQNYRYQNIAAAAPALANMEYFIDTDPGFGNATPISFAATTNLNNLAVVANIPTTNGTHRIYIRSKQNPWSMTSIVPFDVLGPVPVTWSYIKAELQNKNGIISWGTTTEINTKEFKVEHSSTGINFKPIGLQAATGNSTTNMDYTYTHINLPAGLNYYRIKQIDNNGQYKYSEIVTLLNKNGLKNNILAPNPASNYSILILNKPANNTVVNIYNNVGQLMKKITITNGLEFYSLDVSTFAKGKYLVEIINNGNKETLPLIKK